MPECRNWQTNRTQNPAHFTGRVGSSPTSGTIPQSLYTKTGGLYGSTPKHPAVDPQCLCFDFTADGRGLFDISGGRPPLNLNNDRVRQVLVGLSSKTSLPF
jgi:hypothetical protein